MTIQTLTKTEAIRVLLQSLRADVERSEQRASVDEICVRLGEIEALVDGLDGHVAVEPLIVPTPPSEGPPLIPPVSDPAPEPEPIEEPEPEPDPVPAAKYSRRKKR